MNANLKHNLRTGIAVLIAAAGAIMCGNAIAQQVNQDNLKRVSGTVVRVSLAPTTSSGFPDLVVCASTPGPVEVGVRGDDGLWYKVTVDNDHQPAIGATVKIVATSNGPRLSQ
ncbi:hypothetical protein [Burkholderia stabilis]|uniref:hypothetical protein n=1 Tax=Burkholderia stabilis TaxID=95485 RepID=UPI0015919112|nr:hypothetical protein [Burkholderia stabilis]